MCTGSLGIPQIGFFGVLSPPKATKEYSFDSTVLDVHIDNAFQALALDEHREPFSPAVWELPPHSPTVRRSTSTPGPECHR
jgi:hypothetical protein